MIVREAVVWRRFNTARSVLDNVEHYSAVSLVFLLRDSGESACEPDLLIRTYRLGRSSFQQRATAASSAITGRETSGTQPTSGKTKRVHISQHLVPCSFGTLIA